MPSDSWTAVKLSRNHRKIRKEPWNLSSWVGQNLCDHAAQIHALSHARETGRFIHRGRNNIRMDDEICRRKSIAVVDASAGSTKAGIRTIDLNRHGAPRSLQAENGKCQVRACGSRCDTYIMYSWAPMCWVQPRRCSESLPSDINENAFCKCHKMNDKMECCALWSFLQLSAAQWREERDPLTEQRHLLKSNLAECTATSMTLRERL